MIDPQQGELLLLRTAFRPPSFQEDQFQSLLYDYDSGCQQLTWGALRGDAPLQSYLLDGPRRPSADVQLISGCGYALQITAPEWDYDSNTMLHNGTADLLRLGGNGLECCPLSDYGLEGDLSQPIYIPEMESILASSYSYEEERCALYLISPAQLSFTDALAPPPRRPRSASISSGCPWGWRSWRRRNCPRNWPRWSRPPRTWNSALMSTSCSLPPVQPLRGVGLRCDHHGSGRFGGRSPDHRPGPGGGGTGPVPVPGRIFSASSVPTMRTAAFI